ncbi:hypothetical protein NC653_028568 [Populus alba x Populus x berolinensis]|uniref:Uncharacterized protein n=1 Tax=Populus alba x Populus x berolinensis TaxID=444605 RepID=A0AAD6M2V9_9ROSI|nr:hypothetical protein NC653_028568 [Populus alba x Populus x berolinensis]
MKTKGDKIREIRVEGPKCTLNLPDTCYDCKGKALSSEVASSSQLAVPFLAFHFKQFYAYDCPLFFSLYLYYKDEERVKSSLPCTSLQYIENAAVVERRRGARKRRRLISEKIVMNMNMEEMKEIERVGGEGMEEVRDEPEDIKSIAPWTKQIARVLFIF